MPSTSTSTAFKILALGPNPALQRILRFDAPLEVGGVNRAAGVSSYVGGKGQGMALALNRWAPGGAAVAHFLGGDNGRFVESSLAAAGLEQVVQQVAAPTRICTTLIPSSTELIDPSGSVSEEELAGLVDKMDSYLRESAASGGAGVGGLAMCGTTPPGAGALYARVAQRLLESSSGGESPLSESVVLLLDGHKNVDDVLATGRVDVLKINVDEAKALTGQATIPAAAAALMGKVLTRAGALLALTDGPRPAHLFASDGSAWTLTVPEIECVNAIGAGDVCTGVFLHSYVSGLAPEEAFATGLAAACARCTHEQPDFTAEEVTEMRKAVRVEKLVA